MDLDREECEPIENIRVSAGRGTTFFGDRFGVRTSSGHQKMCCDMYIYTTAAPVDFHLEFRFKFVDGSKIEPSDTVRHHTHAVEYLYWYYSSDWSRKFELHGTEVDSKAVHCYCTVVLATKPLSVPWHN